MAGWPPGESLSKDKHEAAAASAQDGLSDAEQYVCTVELEREVLKNAKSKFSIESLSSPDPKAFAVFVVGAAGDAKLRFLEMTNWEAASVTESLKTTNTLYGIPLTTKRIAEVKRIIDSGEPGIIWIRRAGVHPSG